MNSIKSTREAFIHALVELAENRKEIMLVSADSLAAMRGKPFAEKYPERFFELGIAEQNAVAFSTGLASTGLIPFVCTYAGFLTMRACEQIRTFTAYPHLPVKLVGLNGGMFGGEREGVTHQFYEDLGILRAIPGTTILTPCDANEVYSATLCMADIPGPVYLRLGNGREPVVFNSLPGFTPGRINVICEYGKDVLLFTAGFITGRVLQIAEKLHKEGIGATVLNVPTLKPLDVENIKQLFAQCKCAVTIEDHNIIGGLGSAICEIAAACGNVRVIRTGLPDIYPESGTGTELWDHYGLSEENIISAVRQAIHH